MHTVSESIDQRAARIQGLRELADWLEQHPEVPAPGSVTFSAPADDDAEAVEQVEATARALGIPVWSSPGHYGAERRFAGVDFRISHVDRREMDLVYAAASYRGAVEPDPVDQAAADASAMLAATS